MNNDIPALEAELAAARLRSDRAFDAYRSTWKSKDEETWQSAHAEVLSLERQVAAAKGEPYAVPADFPIAWDTGAPLPFLLRGEFRSFLTFYVRDPDPNWDGTYVNVVDTGSSDSVKLCTVTLNRCASAKLGSPNDEVLHGHYLDGRGQQGYTAQIVMNSPWLEEVQTVNGVHSQYRPERWDTMKHFIFWFHDSTFECLAESVTAEVTVEPLVSLLTRLAAQLVEV